MQNVAWCCLRIMIDIPTRIPEGSVYWINGSFQQKQNGQTWECSFYLKRMKIFLFNGNSNVLFIHEFYVLLTRIFININFIVIRDWHFEDIWILLNNMTIFLLDRNSEFLFIYEYYHRYQFGTGILRIYEFYLKMMALFLLDGI